MAGLIIILLYACKLAFLASSTCVKIIEVSPKNEARKAYLHLHKRTILCPPFMKGVYEIIFESIVQESYTPYKKLSYWLTIKLLFSLGYISAIPPGWCGRNVKSNTCFISRSIFILSILSFESHFVSHLPSPCAPFFCINITAPLYLISLLPLPILDVLSLSICTFVSHSIQNDTLSFILTSQIISNMLSSRTTWVSPTSKDKCFLIRNGSVRGQNNITFS